MSTRRRQNFDAPPKSRTALIIGIISAVIVLIVIVVVVIVILLRRRSSGGGGSTGRPACTANTDCPTGKKCKTSTGVCVSCLVSDDCSEDPLNPICNTTSGSCVSCLTDTDCDTDITKPVCGTTGTCEFGCSTDDNCIAPEICNTTTKLCVGCLDNTNCTAPDTCVQGQCCDRSAPTNLTPFLSSFNFNTPIAVIESLFDVSQTPADIKTTLKVYDGSNRFLGQSTPFTPTANGSLKVVSTFTFVNEINLFPFTNYTMSFTSTGSCDGVAWTSDESVRRDLIINGAATLVGPTNVIVIGIASTRTIVISYEGTTSVPGIFVGASAGFTNLTGGINDYQTIVRNMSPVVQTVAQLPLLPLLVSPSRRFLYNFTLPNAVTSGDRCRVWIWPDFLNGQMGIPQAIDLIFS